MDIIFLNGEPRIETAIPFKDGPYTIFFTPYELCVLDVEGKSMSTTTIASDVFSHRPGVIIG